MAWIWLVIVPALIILSVALTFQHNEGNYSNRKWVKIKLPVWIWMLIFIVSFIPVTNWITISVSGIFALASIDDLEGEYRWWGGIPKWLTKKI